MTKRNGIIAASIAAAALATSVSAHAYSFTIQAGEYQMIVNTFINGSVYGMAAGETCGGVIANAANIADCDDAPHLTPTGEPSGSSVDSWGILSVSSITNLNTGIDWFNRGANGFIVGYFDGLTDFFSKQLTASSQKDYSTGGTIKLFTSATNNWNLTVDSVNKANVIASVTHMPVFLDMSFVAGAGNAAADSDGGAAATAATYISTFDSSTSGTRGTGYLRVNGGGTADSDFDTNGYTTYAGLNADAYLSTTISPIAVTDPSCNTQACRSHWLASAATDVYGTVPEPGSVALAGIGLLGLAAVRRRKQSV